MDTQIIEPAEVSSVLIRGEDVWTPIKSLTHGFWRLDDNSGETRGKRGWIIELHNGKRIMLSIHSIDGVQ